MIFAAIVVPACLVGSAVFVEAADQPAPAETPSQTPSQTPLDGYRGYRCYPLPVNPDGTCPTPTPSATTDEPEPTDSATETPDDSPASINPPNINGPNVHRPKSCRRHWYC